VTGIGLALLFFTRIVPLPRLIITDPEPVYGLFFGLILASIVILVGEVRKYGAVEIALTLAGVLAGLAVVNLVPVETPTAPWFIYLCGFVAISAMLLPGISGSFILLILGKYAFIIDAIGHFDVLVMLAFALGALTGLVVFSRTIVWLLERFHQGTLLVIKGILIGSLWMIWPFQERVYQVIGDREKMVGARPVWPEALTGSVVLSLSLALAGFVAVILIHRLSDRKKNPRPEPGIPR
jgi:putative membrane protein